MIVRVQKSRNGALRGKQLCFSATIYIRWSPSVVISYKRAQMSKLLFLVVTTKRHEFDGENILNVGLICTCDITCALYITFSSCQHQ